MEAGYEELVGGRYIKDALAGGNGLVLVVVDVDVPFGPLDRRHIVDTGVGPDQQTLALALDVKGHHTDGVSGGIHRADARYHFVARLNEDRTIGEWLADLHEQLSAEFTRLADALAASPEVELCDPEHVTRVGKCRSAAVGQPTDVVRMAMGDDDQVDVLRLVAGLRQALDQMAVGQPAEPLLVLAAQRAVAGIEQHQLLAGVHNGWNEGMLEAASFDSISVGQLVHGIYWLIAAETGMQPLADNFAVQNISDLESTELEAIDSGLVFALH